MSYVTCGIDESGVGSIIGPIVIAGVTVPEKSEHILKEWGVTDSKRVSSKTESMICRQIVNAQFLECRALSVEPKEIDMAAGIQRQKKKKSNRRRKSKMPERERVIEEAEIDANCSSVKSLMAQRIAEIITDLMILCVSQNQVMQSVYIDSFDSDANALECGIAELVLERCKHVDDITDVALPKIICKTGADLTIPVVSAASVVAGAVHHHMIQNLQNMMASWGYVTHRTGPFTSDNREMYRFIHDYYLLHGELPSFVRSSCRPIKRLVRKALSANKINTSQYVIE